MFSINNVNHSRNSGVISLLVLLLCSSLVVSFAAAAGTCTATASIAPRSGAATFSESPGTTSTIHDLTVTNTGSCPILELYVKFTVPSGANITQTWNLVSSTNGTYKVVDFGALLAMNSPYQGAGLVLSRNNSMSSSTALVVTVFQVKCNSTCSGSMTTSAPTLSPSVSAAPSASMTSSQPNGQCTATASIAPRSGAATFSESQGTTSTIYDMTATNTGSCPISELYVKFMVPSGANITQTWNLVASTNGSYKVVDFGALLAMNSPYQGAGLVLARNDSMSSSTALTVTVYQTKCNSTCSGNSAATTSTAVTSTPTTVPASTSAASTTSSTFCRISATVTLRQGQGWTDGSSNYSIYDVTVTNTLNCATRNVQVLLFLPRQASVNSMWNMQMTSDANFQASSTGNSFAYNILNYGSSLSAGSSYGGAGFVMKQAPSSNDQPRIGAGGDCCSA